MIFIPEIMTTLTVELQDTEIQIQDLEVLFNSGKLTSMEDEGYVKFSIPLGSNNSDDMLIFAYSQNEKYNIMTNQDITTLRNMILRGFAEECVFLEFWKETLEEEA